MVANLFTKVTSLTLFAKYYLTSIMKLLCCVVKEDEGFEPPHGFTRLTVFKTVPFSRTWVIIRYKIYYVFLQTHRWTL